MDFAHLQKWAHKLLSQPETWREITAGIRYVLVDEYQDTNYIQEQILIRLASGSEQNNLIVIGDEDQALYRFRGATVRNILTFAEQTFPGCAQYQLTTNYRSHTEIVQACNRWIEGLDWSHGNTLLRREKSMQAHKTTSRQLPSVIHIDAIHEQDEAEQLADLIADLKERGKIEDYSDVALLLYSVKMEASRPYIEALDERGIPVYCPRAGTFFRQAEIILLFGCLAYLLHYSEEPSDSAQEKSAFSAYLAECQQERISFCQKFPPFARELQRNEQALQHIVEKEGRLDGQYLARCFYQFLFSDHVFPWLKEESRRANLVKFSRLLETFHKHYSYHGTPASGLEELGTAFFERFLSFLYQEGVSEEEDQQRPFLKGHVQIMTIHQAKGLEFPVVLVGRLDRPPYLDSREERSLLQPYFQHPPFEPKTRIPSFDRRRLYYVAFSRARDLLVLSAVKKPDHDFLSLWQESVSWKEVRNQLTALPVYESHKDVELAKPRYGFTTHIQTYQICPRRYNYFYEYRFAPARSTDTFFGQLVHQTIEQLHRKVLAHTLNILDEVQIQETFDKMYTRLLHTAKRPVSSTEKELAWQQILNYYRQNQQELRSIHAAEFPVQIDRNMYILRGKIDLLVDGKKGLEVFDFKTQGRPDEDAERLAFYKQQLQLYAYALQRHTGRLPRRLWLYWTAEEQKTKALMEISCTEDEIKEAVSSVDELAEKIHQKRFNVQNPPASLCKTCDIRRLCQKEGVLQKEGAI